MPLKPPACPRTFVLIVAMLLARAYTGFAGNAITYTPPISVEIRRKIDLPVDPASTGISIIKGAGENLYALTNGPPRLWRIKLDENAVESLDLTDHGIFSPSDLAMIGGLNIQVIDRDVPKIFRFNRRMDFLGETPLSISDQRFEPVSISGTDDGLRFLVNRIDADVWRFERSGSAYPFNASPSGKGWLGKPGLIRICTNLNRLIILDKGKIKISDFFGNESAGPVPKTGEIISFAVTDDELWVLGAGLSCISLPGFKEKLILPPETLKVWGVYPAQALTYGYRDRLYVIHSRGNLIVELEIRRAGSQGK